MNWPMAAVLIVLIVAATLVAIFGVPSTVTAIGEPLAFVAVLIVMLVAL